MFFSWGILPLLNLVLSASFRYIRRAKEKPWNTWLKHVIKIYPNRGHIFQNRLTNKWTAILQVARLYCYKFRYLVWRAKDKNNIKTYQHKTIWVSVCSHGQRHIMESLWCGLAFILNQNGKTRFQTGKSWWQNSNSTTS